MRTLWRIILVLVLGSAATLAVVVLSAPDSSYRLQEIFSFGRYREHDELITQAARKYGVDPMLVKAVVWRESRFFPNTMGAAGERGLMQVGEAAAREWAAAHKVEVFVYADLFDAKTNLEAGSWYLSRALERWKDRDDPVPFALAEYNAGRSRVEKWAGKSATAEVMLYEASQGSAGKYVGDVLRRLRFYRAHGW